MVQSRAKTHLKTFSEATQKQSRSNSEVIQLINLYNRLLQTPWALTAVILLIAGWAALQLGSLRFDASADTLVVDDDPLFLEYLELAGQFSTDEFAILTYTSPDTSNDIFSRQSLAEVDQLQVEIGKLDGVASTWSFLDAPLLESPPIALDELAGDLNTLRSEKTDLNLAKQELTGSPIFSSFLVSPDGSTTAIRIDLTPDRELERLSEERRQVSLGLKTDPTGTIMERYSKKRMEFVASRAKLVEDLRQVRANYTGDAQLYISGVPMIAADMISYVESDLATFGGIVFVLVALMLYIFFRELRWVLLPLLTSAATVLITAGIVSFYGKALTVVSSNFISLLAITSISLTIHLIVRYRELSSSISDRHQLVMETMRSKLAPCAYTMLTTFVAFGSLLASRILPVEDFGWMMCLGVVVAFVVNYTLFPATLLLMRRSSGTEGNTPAVTRFFQQLVMRAPLPISVLAALMAVPCAIGITLLSYDNRFSDYFSETSDIRKGIVQLDNYLGGTLPLDIYLRFDPYEEEEEDDFFDDIEDAWPERYWFTPGKIKTVADIEAAISAKPETGKAISIATLEQVARSFNDGEPLDATQISWVLGEFPADLRSLMIDQYASPQSGWMRINLRLRDSGPLFSKAQLIEDIKTIVAEYDGLKPDAITITGMAVLFENMLMQLAGSQRDTLAYVLGATFLMFAVLLRSIALAIMALLPNVLAAAMVISIMGYAGIPMDIMTTTIAAISIGIGVDDAIHYLHRFNTERRVNDVRTSIMHSHNSIGRAMYLTTVTVIAGFSVLGFSNFTPTINFGILTALAMLLTLLANILVLPATLLAFYGWRERRESDRLPDSS